jgi:hypothetical protein
MDGRLPRRAFTLRLTLAGGFFAILYLYLAHTAHPDFSLKEVIEGVIKLGLFLWNRISPGVWAFFLDVFLFIVAFLIWTAFFAQFTLPLKNLGQRVLAAIYLTLYSLGLHGPAISIENGEIPKRYERDRPHGRGVIILDTASAAVLRTRNRFTRSVGPGLVFTGSREYLAGAVDLHRKASHIPALGPNADDSDPFEAWDPGKEVQEAYDQRQKRRFETSGVTRDGVEIVPNIFTISCLDHDMEPPNDRSDRRGLRSWLSAHRDSETLSRFGFNSEAVRRAITGEAVDPMVRSPLAEKQAMPWFKLPGYLAVDLWREYLRRFTFEELFTEIEGYNGQTALQVIHEKVFQRLTQPYLVEIDPVGGPTNQLVESREFTMLYERGTRVLEVHLRNFRFEKKVDQQLEEKWFSYWHQRAEAEREFIQQRNSYSMHEGEKDAQREFAFQATRRFDPAFLNTPKPDRRYLRNQMREALERLLRGTLVQCVQDTHVHERLSGQETQIIEIINWLRRQ